MNMRYTVLMSVYQKEQPEYLRAAIESIHNQTLAAEKIVVVCDGPLTEALEDVLGEYDKELTLVRLPENVGLGAALAEGLRYCSSEWIARMDSDDIALPDRCEKQIRYLMEHPDVDVLSGTLAEFGGEARTPQEAKKQVSSFKYVPETQQEVAKYIKKRNPINHPCVMFRREKAVEAGSYQKCPLFEDYDLWVRMFLKNCVFANLKDTILYMRVNEMHRRRGGIAYVRAILHFWTKMYRRGMISFPQYLYAVTGRILVSLSPNRVRKIIYDRKLRNH